MTNLNYCWVCFVFFLMILDQFQESVRRQSLNPGSKCSLSNCLHSSLTNKYILMWLLCWFFQSWYRCELHSNEDFEHHRRIHELTNRIRTHVHVEASAVYCVTRRCSVPVIYRDPQTDCFLEPPVDSSPEKPSSKRRKWIFVLKSIRLKRPGVQRVIY